MLQKLEGVGEFSASDQKVLNKNFLGFPKFKCQKYVLDSDIGEIYSTFGTYYTACSLHMIEIVLMYWFDMILPSSAQ